MRIVFLLLGLFIGQSFAYANAPKGEQLYCRASYINPDDTFLHMAEKYIPINWNVQSIDDSFGDANFNFRIHLEPSPDKRGYLVIENVLNGSKINPRAQGKTQMFGSVTLVLPVASKIVVGGKEPIGVISTCQLANF